eukprot:4567375-Amphidinium_carterae.1
MNASQKESAQMEQTMSRSPTMRDGDECRTRKHGQRFQPCDKKCLIERQRSRLMCTRSASGRLCRARCMMNTVSTWTKPKLKKACGACAMHSSPDNSQTRPSALPTIHR